MEISHSRNRQENKGNTLKETYAYGEHIWESEGERDGQSTSTRTYSSPNRLGDHYMVKSSIKGKFAIALAISAYPSELKEGWIQLSGAISKP